MAEERCYICESEAFKAWSAREDSEDLLCECGGKCGGRYAIEAELRGRWLGMPGRGGRTLTDHERTRLSEAVRKHWEKGRKPLYLSLANWQELSI
jgi:hypothetical protein